MKKRKPLAAPKSRVLAVATTAGESQDALRAKVATMAVVPSASIITDYSQSRVGELSLTDVVDQLKAKTAAAQGGDLRDAEAMLIAQAVALNTMFSELARRSAMNFGSHIPAADIYMRLALRAQNQCRATLETLATIKNPPVVFARQTNIAHGHQQVNNGSTARVETGNAQNELLERDNGKRLDSNTTGPASRSDQAMETVEASHGPAHGRRKGSNKP